MPFPASIAGGCFNLILVLCCLSTWNKIKKVQCSLCSVSCTAYRFWMQLSNYKISYFSKTMDIFLNSRVTPTTHSHLFLFQRNPGQILSIDIVKNYFGESMWRLCSAFQTLQGAKRSGESIIKVDFETTREKKNLSSDGTATTARERLNLHVVGTYLK